MYHVNWPDVVTDDALSSIAQLAALDAIDNTRMKNVTAAILQQCGGLPICPEDWSAPQRTAICLKLLYEATGALLRNGLALRAPLPACKLTSSRDSTLSRELSLTHRVDVNLADENQLEPLSVIGPSLAAQIVKERRLNGPFRSSADLADRLNGIGEFGARRLSLALHYGIPGTHGSGYYHGIFEHDFKTLLALQPGDTPEQRLFAALETLATFTAANPHPATSANRIRYDLSHSAATKPAHLVPADSIEILEDEAYYFRMQDILESAKNKIDVAMFFLSFPSPRHPSRILLEKLVNAQNDGVQVRVLVDKDRDDDPYGSRIINRNAIEYLTEHGINVKTDHADQLLHSKFVLIDDSTSIIGSHNWTAGSYFKYHDTSVAIHSSIFTSNMRKRFETIWRSMSMLDTLGGAENS